MRHGRVKRKVEKRVILQLARRARIKLLLRKVKAISQEEK